MDKQLIKIRIEDLASYSTLPFDVLNDKGKIIKRKGEILNSKLMSTLCQVELYKHDHTKEEGPGISKISKETKDMVKNLTLNFYEDAATGKYPPIDGFVKARDKLIEEVSNQIKKMQQIGELRIEGEYDIYHGANVATLSTVLALKLGYEKEEVQDIALGGLMHDIGKVKIPKEILDKPGKLSPKEFEVIKLHPALGYKILRDEYKLSNDIALIALDHHERCDSSGYTRGLVTDRISKYALISAVADVYDAISSDKVYAQAKDPKEVVKELLQISRLFEPKVLYTLIHLINYNTGGLKHKVYINQT